MSRHLTGMSGCCHDTPIICLPHLPISTPPTDFYPTPPHLVLPTIDHPRISYVLYPPPLAIIAAAAIAGGSGSSTSGGVRINDVALARRSPFKTSSSLSGELTSTSTSSLYQTSPLQKHTLSTHPIHTGQSLYQCQSSPLPSASEMDDDDEADIIRWGK